MWQTNYALAVPKNLGLVFDFKPCSEGYNLTGRPKSVAVHICTNALCNDYLREVTGLQSI